LLAPDTDVAVADLVALEGVEVVAYPHLLRVSDVVL
jgi:hypothetical protein